MSITPISGITPIEPIATVFSSDKRSGGVSSSSGFADILSQAMGNAVQAEQEDHTGMIGLLSGADVEPHTVMIESTQAELALNLAIQIRNKVVDAYNEIMRMQV